MLIYNCKHIRFKNPFITTCTILYEFLHYASTRRVQASQYSSVQSTLPKRFTAMWYSDMRDKVMKTAFGEAGLEKSSEFSAFSLLS